MLLKKPVAPALTCPTQLSTFEPASNRQAATRELQFVRRVSEMAYAGERISNIGSVAGPAMPLTRPTTGSNVLASQLAAGSGDVIASVPSFTCSR